MESLKVGVNRKRDSNLKQVLARNRPSLPDFSHFILIVVILVFPSPLPPPARDQRMPPLSALTLSCRSNCHEDRHEPAAMDRECDQRALSTVGQIEVRGVRWSGGAGLWRDGPGLQTNSGG